MTSQDRHYRKLIKNQQTTRFASCGYRDRFDPFVLNKSPAVRHLYDGLFKTFLSDVPADSLLDIGCGTGIYFDVLAGYVTRIEAIDESFDMIGIADDYCRLTGLSNIHTRVGSAGELPYGDESFDVVIAMDLLHHVPDAAQAVAEVKRVLKPGGRFFVFEPNICNPLMFVAHALPAEERRALRLNRPGKLLTFLERSFDTIRWYGVCALVTQSGGIKGAVLDFYVKLWKLIGIKRLYPRQAWLGGKR